MFWHHEDANLHIYQNCLMPTLDWIGKQAVVNHDKDVPFRLLKRDPKLSVGDSQNLLIRGDNLEALKALMPYYIGKVKCVYIDPPYNTGNEKWVYNDNVNSQEIRRWLGKVVGGKNEDLSRHDKWLCMMYPRLSMLRQLLEPEGVIFISIDDNELHRLRMMMDEIFGEGNMLVTFIWKKKAGGGDDSGHAATEHEYVLCYGKDAEKSSLASIEHESSAMTAKYSRKENGRRYYLERLDKTSLTYSKSMDFEIECPDGTRIKPPQKDTKNPKTIWRWSKKKIEKQFDDLIFEKEKKTGEWRIYTRTWESLDGVTPRSLLVEQQHGRNRDGTQEIAAIFGTKVFSNPKPTKLVRHLLRIGCGNNPNAIVLDSFAGSGTTGHAVLQLNKEDGGQRRFVMVEMENKIAEKITAARLRRVIRGYAGNESLGGGFQFMHLDTTLFDAEGNISEPVTYLDLARYVFFVETQKDLDEKKMKKPSIGTDGETAYFLFFTEKGKNTVTRKELAKLPKTDGCKVVYGDRCLVSEETLRLQNVVFKQIPYQVKIY